MSDRNRVGERGQVTRDDIAAGYRARTELFRDLHEEMDGVSREANAALGDVPEWN